MSRQLSRLDEEYLDVVEVSHESDEELLEGIKAELDDKTSAVMISRIYFETAEVNTKVSEIAAVCREAGVPLMIDDYHGTNVVPLSVRDEGLEDCFILIGGYKYLQWGEANCFLRFPKSFDLRPVITGWFASFETLDQPQSDGPIQFDDGDQRLPRLRTILFPSFGRQRLSTFSENRDSHLMCFINSISHRWRTLQIF